MFEMKIEVATGDSASRKATTRSFVKFPLRRAPHTLGQEQFFKKAHSLCGFSARSDRQ